MPIRPRLRFEVLQRDGFACRYCGARSPQAKLHVDHVVPRALGGKDDVDNLVSACSVCNLGKAAKAIPGTEDHADAYQEDLWKVTDAVIELVHVVWELQEFLYEQAPPTEEVIARLKKASAAAWGAAYSFGDLPPDDPWRENLSRLTRARREGENA